MFLNGVYCSDATGHGIEKCWSLMKAIQKLIDAGNIVIQNPDAADTSQSPSSVHNETHMLECENSSGSLGGTRVAELSALSEVDLKNEPREGPKSNLLRTM